MILVNRNKKGFAVTSVQVANNLVIGIHNSLDGVPYIRIGEKNKFLIDHSLTIMTDNGIVIGEYTYNQLIEEKYLKFEKDLRCGTLLKSRGTSVEVMQVNQVPAIFMPEGSNINTPPDLQFWDDFGKKIILADAATASDFFKVVYGPEELIGIEPTSIRNKGYEDYTIWALSNFDKPDSYIKNYVGINYIDIGPLVEEEFRSKWRINFWRDQKWIVEQIVNDVSADAMRYFNEEVARVKRNH